LLAVAAAGALPAAASASCYFVYSAKNELIYRSTISPVDLSRPISESLRGRFAGGHLVMIPDETGCPDLLSDGESRLFATLGFSNKGAGGRRRRRSTPRRCSRTTPVRGRAPIPSAPRRLGRRQPAARPPQRADRPASTAPPSTAPRGR
jgi:hypothetical protein